MELEKKAGFRTLAETAKLQTMEGHQSVRDGVYKHIGHPSYLGGTIRDFWSRHNLLKHLRNITCFGGNISAAFRIRMEERVLIQVFGDKYREYQRIRRE